MKKSNFVFNIGIIGCGNIGKKRAASLSPKGKLVACVDLNFNKAVRLADKYKAKAYDNWQNLLTDKNIDIVIVSTTHDSLTSIAKSALECEKNVLLEKPAGRNLNEIDDLIKTLKKSDKKLRIGFNHRYHPAIQKAKKLIDEGAIGELMFIRGRYGHGGRIGYDREWRSNPKLSGGGELIDQGSHMIDLSRWFLGDLSLEYGLAQTLYWDMDVDDNAFFTLINNSKKVSQIHVSCTEWKNLFSVEIYGKLGKLEVSGLGASYGLESIKFYKMLPKMGPPDTMVWKYPGKDVSWLLEIKELYNDILFNREPTPNLYDAKAILKIIKEIYKYSGYNF